MEPFKSAISPDLVRLTGRLLSKAVPSVDPHGFAAPLVPKLEELELKQRVMLVADALHDALPTSSEERMQAMLDMLHPDDMGGGSEGSTEDGLRGWGLWPLTHVVGQHGLGSTERSLSALREMTKRGTSEFDVRPFIADDPETALPIISAWADDPNFHVRRLVSEGTRPRLPWGMRLSGLVADPSPMVPVLKRLRDDPSDYVRRSVANHLNDIAKDHPDLVVTIAQSWMKGADTTREKLLRHACRTLIKQGHPGVLAAFGVHAPKISDPHIDLKTPTVAFGDALEFEVELRSTDGASQQVILDYVVHHKKADGSLSPKVFKWTKLTLPAKGTHRLVRRHPIRPITTRRYYPGPHALSLRINGKDFGNESFDLTMAEGEG